MPARSTDIRKAGVGPVDMQQSVIGPGMGVFSRYAKVLEDDDSADEREDRAALINRVWEEIENDLDANFDPETQVALAWFATYGFDARPSGELIRLANAKNIPLEALFGSGVFKDLHGKAALTAARQTAGGLVARDRQDADGLGMRAAHRARADAPRTAAARRRRGSCAQMGPRAGDARALAYRLFEIATARRAGRPRRWSTTSWRRNGRSSKTCAATSRSQAGAGAGQPDLVRRGRAMTAEKETLRRVQGALFHLRRGLDALRRGADEGTPRRALAALCEPRRRGRPARALDVYGSAQDDDRQLARGVRRRISAATKSTRSATSLSMALEARNATAHLTMPLQDDEALRYLDAMHQLLRAVKAPPDEIAELKTLYDAQRQIRRVSASHGSDRGRRPRRSQPAAWQLEPARSARQGAEALDRGGAAASRRARQPLQGGGVRRRPVRGRCRPRRPRTTRRRRTSSASPS